ncbi:MAG TPA: methyltransferase [Bryobacteraceae bacterium]|nr:methyltransferase [Bryobacteraceae bacterium]
MSARGQVQVTPERLQQMAWGYTGPLILEAAVRHGVFDRLDEGPKTLDEVAAATGASHRGLRAILNALVGFQLLARDGEGRYSLLPESAVFLVSGKPTFIGGILKHTSSQLMPIWMQLNEVVARGGPTTGVNQERTGSEFFHEFVEDIFPMSYPAAQNLARALNVADATGPMKVLDLAAGSGVWSIALAQHSAHVSVTAVDWPGVLDVTRRVATRFGLVDRYTFVSGDLLEADFGRAHHIATLGHILHSEGAERSRILLRKTYDALEPGGTIAIAEFLVNDDRTGPPMGLIFAVNMLVATENGDTFSFSEISKWLDQAGFENARLLESPGPSPLILANRPK